MASYSRHPVQHEGFTGNMVLASHSPSLPRTFCLRHFESNKSYMIFPRHPLGVVHGHETPYIRHSIWNSQCKGPRLIANRTLVQVSSGQGGLGRLFIRTLPQASKKCDVSSRNTPPDYVEWAIFHPLCGYSLKNGQLLVATWYWGRWF